MQPGVCGSAFKNKGVQPLLDAVVDYLPSPLDIPPIEGIDPTTAPSSSAQPTDDAPFSALVFKIMTDPFVGQLAFFRVYSGHVESGTAVLQLDQGHAPSASAASCKMHANKREEIKEVCAGDIAAAVGLQERHHRRHDLRPRTSRSCSSR